LGFAQITVDVLEGLQRDHSAVVCQNARHRSVSL
jgi:hypothetical protein